MCLGPFRHTKKKCKRTTEGVIEGVGQDLGVLAITRILLSVKEPVGDLQEIMKKKKIYQSSRKSCKYERRKKKKNKKTRKKKKKERKKIHEVEESKQWKNSKQEGENN